MPTERERNPKVDPKPGDVLAVDRSRPVTVLDDGDIMYVDQLHNGRFYTVKTLFLEWAKDAEVIHRAD